MKNFFRQLISASLVLTIVFCTVFTSGFPMEVSAAAAVGTPKVDKAYGSTVNSITLSWGRTSGADGYRIYRKEPTGYKKLATIHNASVTSYTDTKVTSGSSYAYKVKAFSKRSGKTEWGKASSAKYAAAKPQKVAYTGYSYSLSAVRLKWKAQNASGYQIYQKVSDKWVKLAEVSGGSSDNYRISGLQSGTEYTFKMRAYTKTADGGRVYGTCKGIDTATKSADPAENRLLHMTLHEKVCQLFMPAPESLTGSYSSVTQSGTAMKNALNKYPVGGIIYFAPNLVTRSQTTTMISNAQKYSKSSCGAGLLIAVDEEGGSVARCADKLGTHRFNNMAYYGAAGDTSVVKNIGRTIGEDISQFGFNVDFAPVADVDLNPGNELGERIFSSNPQVVAEMTAAFTDGIQDTGVSATLKHFPGLGAASGNTHYDGSVYITRTINQLRSNEFKAFKGGIDEGADFVMVGHQKVSCAGDNMPADLSKTVITGWLRGELGFNGLVVTDSQSMATITNNYSSGEAALASINAGADVILMPNNLPNAVSTVESAVKNGALSEERIDESVMRILRLKAEKGLIK